MECSFKGVLIRNDDHLYNYHIIIPEQIISTIRKNKMTRFLCSINGGEKFHSSLIPAGNDQHFIKVNKEIRHKSKIDVGSNCHIKITPDNSKYGIPMPEEMMELLMQDPEGDAYFHKLTPGKQRSLLFLINKVKSPSIRLEKALIIIEHLTEMRGELDYKILNQDFKTKKGTF